MKATGIVRRIDELGRVVIPKEIRRTLDLAEGDPLELYLGEDGKTLVLSRYNAPKNYECINRVIEDLEGTEPEVRKMLATVSAILKEKDL